MQKSSWETTRRIFINWLTDNQLKKNSPQIYAMIACLYGGLQTFMKKTI